MEHGQGSQHRGRSPRLQGLAGGVLVALLLAGCASLESQTAGPPSTGAAAESATASESARAAPAAVGRQKPAEAPYPTFGAPAQIGDRPVMTPQQQQAVQKNLETLASQREKEMLRQIEDDQGGTAGQ